MADFAGQELPPLVFSVVAESANSTAVIPSGGAVTAIYAQRVWSTGLGAWCYYTAALNQTPAPGDTTPNWTGSIIDYNVVSRRLN